LEHFALGDVFLEAGIWGVVDRLCHFGMQGSTNAENSLWVPQEAAASGKTSLLLGGRFNFKLGGFSASLDQLAAPFEGRNLLGTGSSSFTVRFQPENAIGRKKKSVHIRKIAPDRQTKVW